MSNQTQLTPSLGARPYKLSLSDLVYGDQTQLDTWWSQASTFLVEKVPSSLSHFNMTNIKWHWTNPGQNLSLMDMSDLPKNFSDLKKLLTREGVSVDLTKITILDTEGDEDYVVLEEEFNEPEPDEEGQVKEEWMEKKAAFEARVKRVIPNEEKIAMVKVVEFFTATKSVAELFIRKYGITSLSKFLTCKFVSDYQSYLQIQVPRLAFLLPAGNRNAFIRGSTWNCCS